MYKNERQAELWAIIERDPKDLPMLMHVKDAALILDRTPKHVYDLLKGGRLKGSKTGKSWRVNRDSLLEVAGLA